MNYRHLLPFSLVGLFLLFRKLVERYIGCGNFIAKSGKVEVMGWW